MSRIVATVVEWNGKTHLTYGQGAAAVLAGVLCWLFRLVS